MIFFDFLYYYIFSFYRTSGSKGPEAPAAFSVAGLQTFNILSVIMAYYILTKSQLDVSKLFCALLYICIAIFDYFLYVFPLNKQAKIENKWNSKSNESKSTFESFLVIYIILSIIIIIGLVFVYRVKSVPSLS